MRTVHGQKILITSGHKRIGRALALHLGRQGAVIAVHYRHDPEAAAEVVMELASFGAHALAVQAELTDPQSVRAMLQFCGQSLGGLDAVVAAAANYVPTDLDRPDAAHFDSVWANNARAPVDLILAAEPWLTRSGDGRAVIIGDLAGITPFFGYSAHSMAKAALHNGVLALAAELAPAIAVNAVLPGAVLKPKARTAAQWQQLQEHVPQGSLALADPDLPVRALADAVQFLITCERYISGVLLPVDGGRLTRW